MEIIHTGIPSLNLIFSNGCLKFSQNQLQSGATLLLGGATLLLGGAMLLSLDSFGQFSSHKNSKI
jgi:hypothetical protein